MSNRQCVKESCESDRKSSGGKNKNKMSHKETLHCNVNVMKASSEESGALFGNYNNKKYLQSTVHYFLTNVVKLLCMNLNLNM